MMPSRTAILPIVVVTALLNACASDGWTRMQKEYPEVRANCGLSGALLQRDAADERLLRLVFRQRHNAALQASRNGSLACVEHWAREHGWRVTTAPSGVDG